MLTRIIIREASPEDMAVTLRMIAQQIEEGFTHGEERGYEHGAYHYATADDFTTRVVVESSGGMVQRVLVDDAARVIVQDTDVLPDGERVGVYEPARVKDAHAVAAVFSELT